MARRAAGMILFGIAVLGVPLTACGSPSAAGSSSPVGTATATLGPPPTPTAPPIPLSIYYGPVAASNGHGVVYALSAADGSIRWTHQVGAGVISVSVADGMVYAATNDHKLTALRASDGSQVWQVATHDLISPFILADGVIYTGSMASSDSHGFVDAYRTSDGARLWEYDGGSCSFSEMAADATALYLGPAGCQQNILALRTSDGSVLWKSQVVSIGGGITAANGAIYANEYGDIYALGKTDGRQLWHDNLSHIGEGGFAPSVANGVVYVTDAAAIYALQAANGAHLWSKPGRLAISPIVDSSTVYFIPGGNTLDALNPTTGSTLWQFTKTGSFSYPTSVNGILYVILGPGPSASTAYTVYALHASDGSVMWQHTGNDGGAASVTVG